MANYNGVMIQGLHQCSARVLRHCASGLLALVLFAVIGGCGNSAPPQFVNCLKNQDGECILLDDVERVLNDDALSSEEKREALRDLGIEDEEVIDALVN